MPTGAALITRTRRFLGDYPDIDSLGASCTSSATSLTVGTNPASGIYAASGNWIIQIDSEIILQTSASSSAATIAVRRGVRGSTPASHASGATVLIRPAWTDLEYLDGINSGIVSAFPLIYERVVDESITTVSQTWEYTVPVVSSTSAYMPYIVRLSCKETGDLTYRPKRDWTVLRGSTPKIKFRRDEPAGTLRVEGFGPVVTMSDVTSSLSSVWPSGADDYLILYTAQYLMMSGESQRVRQDTGARDDRDNASKPGSSTAAANSIYQRARQRLIDNQMPPMPKHVSPTF